MFMCIILQSHVYSLEFWSDMDSEFNSNKYHHYNCIHVRTFFPYVTAERTAWTLEYFRLFFTWLTEEKILLLEINPEVNSMPICTLQFIFDMTFPLINIDILSCLAPGTAVHPNIYVTQTMYMNDKTSC